jgi:hypothetical protein
MNELPPQPEDGLVRRLFRLPRPILGLVLMPILAVVGIVVIVVSWIFGYWWARP